MGIFKKRAETGEAPARPALVASAARVELGNTLASKVSTEGWQQTAYHYFDCIGEYRAVATWVGNLLSRATLFATYDDGDGPKRLPPSHPANQFLDALAGGTEGQSHMLGEIGVQYTVAGEAYLLGWEEGGRDQWMVTSGLAIKKVGSQWQVGDKILPEDTLVVRIWNPHPVDPKKANSPSRAALPILASMERLQQREAAQLDSALASAGVAFFPKDMQVAGTEVGSDGFMDHFIEVVSAGLANPGDASSLVPTFVFADADQIEAVKHINFSTPLDEASTAKMEQLQKRLALSLDVPPEIMSGVGDTNHWSAWAIDESSIKSHTEPLLRKITADLARAYLQPLLSTEDGLEGEPWQYGIGADTSEMRLRPNRSKEALELYDRGELSAEALLRETGFQPDDAMGDDERKQWLIRKLADGSATPDQVAQAYRMLGIPIESEVDAGEVREARPSPSLLEHPSNELPDEAALAKARQQAALTAAAEQMVYRALERAGNRLKTKYGSTTLKNSTLKAWQMYSLYPITREDANELLADAWDRVQDFGSRLGVDHRQLAAALHAYTTFLLVEGATHDSGRLDSYLTKFITEEE